MTSFARRLLIVPLVAPVILSRLPSGVPNMVDVAIALTALVVLLNLLPGKTLARPWRAVGLAAFGGLVLVPPSSASFLGSVPAWTAGVPALLYVGHFYLPKGDPAPWSGGEGRADPLRDLLRSIPLAILLIAAVFLPMAMPSVLPRTVYASYEVGDVLLPLAITGWVGAAALTASIVVRPFGRARPTLRDETPVAPPIEEATA